MLIKFKIEFLSIRFILLYIELKLQYYMFSYQFILTIKIIINYF